MNYTNGIGNDLAVSPMPTKEPRSDSIVGLIQEQSKMIFECRRIVEDILYVLGNISGKEPTKEPENLMQNAASNLELTKGVIEELIQLKDLICG